MCEAKRQTLLNANDLKKITKRRKLWELDVHWHCAVIGTCLSAAEINKLGQKCQAPHFASKGGDYKLHSYMVGMARQQNGAGKVLHKYLERKYARNVKAFSTAKTADEVEALWLEAWERGDVPGPFWAVLTHQASSIELIAQVYGEVHMLSHLEGASNRADHRQLADLKATIDLLQGEMNEMRRTHLKALGKRDHLIGELKIELKDASVKARKCDELEALLLSEREGESLVRLEHRIDCLTSRVIQETDRADMAQNRLVDLEGMHKEALFGLRQKDQRVIDLEREVISLESGAVACMEEEDCAGKGDLCGRCIAYVGGQTRQAAFFRDHVEKRNGQFLHHDGGLHDGQARLQSILSQADAVMFPVTCVSHEATREIKRVCMKQAKPFIPLRSQGLGAFTRGLEGLEEDGFGEGR